MSGSGSSKNHCREARTRAEEPERVCTRAPPKRVGRAFALLTQTYHGSQLRDDGGDLVGEGAFDTVGINGSGDIIPGPAVAHGTVIVSQKRNKGIINPYEHRAAGR